MPRAPVPSVGDLDVEVARALRQGGGVSTGPTPPPDPPDGTLWLDKATGRLFMRDAPAGVWWQLL